jgi:hypothetical protein
MVCPTKRLHKFSSLFVGRRPIPTGLEARPNAVNQFQGIFYGKRTVWLL